MGGCGLADLTACRWEAEVQLFSHPQVGFGYEVWYLLSLLITTGITTQSLGLPAGPRPCPCGDPFPFTKGEMKNIQFPDSGLESGLGEYGAMFSSFL